MATETVVDIAIQLTGELATKLEAEAERRGVNPADLLAAVIETVIKDNLFAAVVDT